MTLGQTLFESCRVGERGDLVFPSAPFQDVCRGEPLCAALQRVNHMIQEGVYVSSTHFSHLLWRCVDEQDPSTGKQVYNLIVKSGFEVESLMASHLIHMFASLEDLVKANEVFRKLSIPDTLTWSAIISAHVKLGHNAQAIDLYNQMWGSRIQPNREVFVAVLQACSGEAFLACTSTMALEQGRKIHAHITETGLGIGLFVGNTLIDMYSKCERLQEACQVFDKLFDRDVISWNALITGCVYNGHCQEALYLFRQMQRECMEPNRVTFLATLKACSIIASLKEGEQVHVCIVERGLEHNALLGSTLIDMYVKCGMLEGADMVFCRLCVRDDVTWSVLIEGYVQHGLCCKALQIFQQMQLEHVEPTSFTFVSIIKACSSIGALEEGNRIHSQAIEFGIESHVFVGNSLIDMYGKCGSLDDAQLVFDGMRRRDAVTWSALISGYTQHGHGHVALQLFERLQGNGCIDPDPALYVAGLKACLISGTLEQQWKIHSRVVESGFESNVYVGSTIIDMYAKDGYLEDACAEFGRLPMQNVATWSALIAGYAHHERAKEALLLFRKMQECGIEPNQVTFVCVLQACSNIAALETGKQVQAQFNNLGLELDVFIGSALIDMYSRCGCLQDALTIFDSLPTRNVVTWNALIAGFSLHSNHESAFNIFKDMLQAGIRPNEVTFLCLLSACSHAGLVAEGSSYFRSMTKKHGVLPRIQHLNSMVDLLGRAGHLIEAEELLESIPFIPDATGWTSLLSASKTHSSVQVGRRCFDYMVASSNANAGAYVLMSSIYSLAGMQEDAKRVEELRRYANAWKKPAKAFIEIDNQVHDFVAGDKSHPQWHGISARLKTLSMQMRNEGYKPRVDLVTDTISDEEKVDTLCGHSEKLAIAFGLISMPDHTTIRVAKNLRMCADCHTMAKMASRIEMREIFVTDAYCVHQFRDGTCSCKGHYQ